MKRSMLPTIARCSITGLGTAARVGDVLAAEPLGRVKSPCIVPPLHWRPIASFQRVLDLRAVEAPCRVRRTNSQPSGRIAFHHRELGLSHSCRSRRGCRSRSATL